MGTQIIKSCFSFPTIWAGRSVVDRLLRKQEARGSKITPLGAMIVDSLYLALRGWGKSPPVHGPVG